MNKKGGIFFSIIIAIFLFASGVLFIPFFTDDVTTFRTHMDCTNSSISSGEKLTCLEGDLLIPVLIWFFVSLALGFIIGGNIVLSRSMEINYGGFIR